jgi:hypothetical protein
LLAAELLSAELLSAEHRRGRELTPQAEDFGSMELMRIINLGVGG